MTQGKHIGERVLWLRSERELSRERLAELSGVHWRTIEDIERGKQTPRLVTCMRIAKGLGVPVEELTEQGDAA